ncbi:filamentous haemagglutinin family protein [Herbaspirillum sp. RV1423]|uniref:filamentous haemagglutinin family protein n=1 Tax=Herbaspirillum sp. RV1423 TaxID=1443993 RepID=UPI0004BB89F5|nr:filamentous haemagglutinin family protein [Herbaspirillum sp. RV1423]
MAAGVKLDASGMWSNLQVNPDDISGMPAMNGGTVSVRGTRDVLFGKGSLIDVSSGAAMLATGKSSGGKGGDLTLQANAGNASGGNLAFDGMFKGYGVNGGGTLSLSGGNVVIGTAANAALDTLVLDAAFFNKGFSQYQVTGSKGLMVSDGAQVDVSMPVYRFGANAGAALSVGDGLELWTPPLYQENPSKGVLTQRKGASLFLQAGNLDSSAADMASVQAVVGKGAVINVDAGQSIGIASIGQLTVDGRLNAWGGKITLGGVSVNPGAAEGVEAGGHSRSIWIGEQAVLDVAARAVTATDINGHRYGRVRNGGSIVIGGEINEAVGNASAASLFVVVRDGALLDASGTQAILDVNGMGAVNVASQGGSISLASNNGLYLDGVLRANAGGAGAAGGTLNVALESPVYKSTAVSNVLNARELVLAQTQSADPLTGVNDPAQAAATLTYGHGDLSVAQVQAGGFDSLSLLSQGTISLAGNINLKMAQNLQLYGGFTLAAGAPASSDINLAASYLRLAGTKAASRDSYVSARAVDTASRAMSAGISGTANLIDIRGDVLVNTDRLELVSADDLRFLGISDGWNGTSPTTSLTNRGDIVLRAAQLYPGTGVGAVVRAGYNKTKNGIVSYDPARSLIIGRTTDYLPAMPYSAFGFLQLFSAHVEQGGIVRAPLGYISLGTTGFDDNKTLSVNLLDHSLTSVSGAGLIMPYGGTVDGQSWSYDGKTVKFTGVGSMTTGVTLAGESVAVKSGAVLDLSGGGELLGAGFVSGRGGSTDARFNPLLQYAANSSFTLPGLTTNPVYAIVPGMQGNYAPISGEHGAVDPAIGRQITIGSGVPGLPAGTYTLMPSTYALMPGAFRVEINGIAGQGGFTAAQAMRNGSWSTAGTLSIAGTDVRDSLASQLIVTPAKVLRTYSQYNETGYTAFALADAARLGVPRPMLPLDARTLQLELQDGAGAIAFKFEGEGRFSAAPGGYGGTVAVTVNNGNHRIEIVQAGAQPTAGFSGVTLEADSLNRIGAARMLIGGKTDVRYGQNGNYVDFGNAAYEVDLRSGAQLYAPEVFLFAADPPSGQGPGLVNIEQGAGISTLGRGKAAYDSSDGFIYRVSGHMVAASNGLLNATPNSSISQGGVTIGGCSSGACTGTTTLYSEGTLLASTTGSFVLDDAVRYGTRNLTLAVGAINAGSAQALADAKAAGIRSAGLAMNQDVLNRLLRGDTSTGAPAIQTLVLSAANSVNFYGDVTLDTYDAVTGKSTLDRFVLTTPAIYGYGGAGTAATIHTANLIWGGAETSPSSIIANGAGTGIGTLNLNTERLEFGFGPFTQPNNIKSYDRLALGFANVNLNASERVTANQKGSLSVYQSQGTYQSGSGFQYSGGNLNISTPLLTGAAGSVNNIVVGGNINLSAPMGASLPARSNDALGAEISLHGNNVTVATTVALPSGKLTLIADQDLTLSDAAQIDVAGGKIPFNDIDKYSWGGTVILESRNGDIRQAAGSSIDLSAVNNKGGSLTATALADTAGMVDLQGRILGGSSGYYDAGGTMVPYLAGSVEVRAQTLGSSGTLNSQFAALNTRLNEGSVFGGRSFQLKQGDLAIGNEVKANAVNVSVDNGSLAVNGAIDASGERVGTIRLAATKGLTIGSNAVLDAHSTVLRVDSYGKIIDSPNRAIVELNSGNGVLTLASGAQIDLRHGTNTAVGNDGVARGTLDLNAARIGSNGKQTDADAATYGDIAIDARGSLNIRGARSIAVNGVQRYDDAPLGTVKDAAGNDVLDANGKPVLDLAAGGRPYQVINQDYLKAKDKDSNDFINGALANSNLLTGKLSGLNNATYANALHLRPGVEIVSNAVTNPGGDMVVQGDLDLSGFRYASLNPRTPVVNGVYGSGEVGTLTLRAAGNLDIFGSINDGFAPPPPTPDDKGWILLSGRDFTGGDIVVPGTGVTLADGSGFPGGTTLNYDLPIKDFSISGGSRLPVAATLAQDLTLPAGTVLAAAVRDAGGNILFAAGSLLNTAQTLVAGTQLDAGTVLTTATALKAMTWPKGVPLPKGNLPLSMVQLNGDKALATGSLIPSGADVKLPGGAASVALRPEVGGRQGQLWAIAPMLAEGSQSWSMRLVAGADLGAADSRTVQTRPVHSDLRLADSHYGMYGVGALSNARWTQAGADEIGRSDLVGEPIDPALAQYNYGLSVNDLCNGDYSYACAFSANPTYDMMIGSSRFSVLRTGTGDLELLSGGNLRMDSLFGVYTAGSSAAATFANDPYNQPKGRNANGKVLSDPDGTRESLVDGSATSVYRAWYPDQGGNLLLKVGGNLSGAQMMPVTDPSGHPNPSELGYDTTNAGNWLWRQGSGSAATGGAAQPTAWWINFGSYTALQGNADKMVGFTGFGTLGGGNLNVQVIGDAGFLSPMVGSSFANGINPRSQGLVLAVGSTGRVAADGSVQLTGGGDLDVRVGGTLNPGSDAYQSHLNGAAVNLRGNVQLSSAQLGSLPLSYDSRYTLPRESRASDPFTAARGRAYGGLTLVPGDAVFNIDTLGDLVVQDVADPGRVTSMNASPFISSAGVNGRGQSWFTLWTAHTALNLFSAGGNLAPYTQGLGTISDDAVLYPSIVRAVAASGSLYYGKATRDPRLDDTESLAPMVLAPGANGQLQFLAAGSIYAAGFSVSQSGAPVSALATPQQPAFAGWVDSVSLFAPVSTNVSPLGNPLSSQIFPLFVFGADSAAGQLAGNADPARFYALSGDLVGVSSGRILSYADRNKQNGRVLPRFGQTWYEGAQPVWMMAGRDIVGSGNFLAQPDVQPDGSDSMLSGIGNLFVHTRATDVSVVSAGRDILYSSFNVAGPGTLEITAGRNILMQDKGAVTSIGAIVPGDTRPGAGIVMQAGVGSGGLDYLRFVMPYLDPANLAQNGVPLADQSGKVAKTYEAELVAWLSQRYGFSGDGAAARAYYLALPPEQQRVFARTVYFAELQAGGREYNDVNSPRYGNYLRGRNAIAALAPGRDANGKPVSYAGDIIMYKGMYTYQNPGNGQVTNTPRSGYVRTLFGGDIQMLTPGGQIVLGIEGAAPTSTSGVITQGSGNIQLFAKDSILLGQSRVMTTFGGSILGWSATGDINAGRGSKTTVVYTPPKRVYDQWGNVTLSSDVPSTGAGIATLAPIPEVPAGDIDLIAPLGTIDAGEAGIRVSGNVNLAALQVINAANIQVKGESVGIPTIAAVNVGALTNASAAVSSAASAAQESVQRARNEARQALPSIFTVRVLGFGNESSGTENRPVPVGAGYQNGSAFQVLGQGELTPAQRSRLTDTERRNLTQ